MRCFLSVLVIGGLLLLMSAIAAGLVISVESGHTNWLLMGVFGLDCLVLAVIGVQFLLRRRVPGTADRGV